MDGVEIARATSSTYVPEVSGEYSLRVTLEGCTQTSAPLHITVSVTGIFESADRGVIFYPNPARDFIRVRLETPPSSGAIKYSITNALGMDVANGTVDPAVLLKGSDIDIRSLPSGIYFLNLRSAEWKLQRKFIVETR